jgi:hypothetical protein
MQSIRQNSNQAVSAVNTASTVERVLSAAGLFGGAVGVFFVSYFNPVTAGFFPVCPFYATTGLHCPGCGMTRAFHAFFHGDILGALHYNALLPIFFLVFVYFGVSMFLVLARGRRLSFNIFRPILLSAFLVLMLIFAVVRNLPYYPFTLLAPQ